MLPLSTVPVPPPNNFDLDGCPSALPTALGDRRLPLADFRGIVSTTMRAPGSIGVSKDPVLAMVTGATSPPPDAFVVFFDQHVIPALSCPRTSVIARSITQNWQ